MTDRTATDMVCTECSAEYSVPFRSGPSRKVCSDECFKARARARSNAWYREADHSETDFRARRKRASDRYIAKVRADPDLAAKRHATAADWRARNLTSIREYERSRWQTNRDQIVQKLGRRRSRKLAAFIENVSPMDVWYRDWGICGICKEPIDPDLKWPNKMSMTLDHVVALANGGMHEMANIQLAHAVCNCRKGDRW
jgi:5-methylcytosine-specific restriction endonuclease McrA